MTDLYIYIGHPPVLGAGFYRSYSEKSNIASISSPRDQEKLAVVFCELRSQCLPLVWAGSAQSIADTAVTAPIKKYRERGKERKREKERKYN